MISNKSISRSGSRVAVLDGRRSTERASKRIPFGAILLRYVFYGFVFTVPLDGVSPEHLFGGIFSNTFALSKLVGYVLLALSLVNFRLCYRRIPAAFVCIVAYFGIYLVLGLLQGPFLQGPSLAILRQNHTITLVQMIVLFLISYNLLLSERIAKGALWSFAVACTTFAILQAQGITSRAEVGARVSAVGGDANTVAAILVVGLVVFVGLAYGLKKPHWTSRVFLLLSFGILGSGILVTGSRTAVVALAAALMVFALRRGGVAAKVKILSLIVLLLCALGVMLLQSEMNVERWTRTLGQGDTAARDEIFPVLVQLFLEKPVLGWGPIAHREELSRRLGETTDPHNLYLWILTEVGLLGSVPFFLGLYLCFRAAWKARFKVHGILPMSLLICISLVNMTGSYHNSKFFWLVLAYVLASAAVPYVTNSSKTARVDRFIRERRVGTAVWG